MSTLRQALAQAPPPVAMKEAWRAYLQAVRQHGRLTGERGHHHDRASLERTLDQPAAPPAEALSAIKAELLALVHGGLDPDAAGDCAARVDRALVELAGAVAAGTLAVRVEGWPPGVDEGLRGVLVGRPWADPLRLCPSDAAALVAALDGQILGGRRLSVQVDLPPGQRLPAAPRPGRDRSRRAAAPPWLPHLDGPGRWSLTPRALALRQAALLPGPVVVDAFCGCGGNALGLALAGRRVIAVERDPTRLDLARRNARALGLALDLRLGDAATLLPDLAARHPGADLLLDPPWGGPGTAGRPVGWSELVPLPAAALAGFGRVLLKAPRAFDLDTLPTDRRWRQVFEPSDPGADGRCVVQCITCLGSTEAPAAASKTRG